MKCRYALAEMLYPRDHAPRVGAVPPTADGPAGGRTHAPHPARPPDGGSLPQQPALEAPLTTWCSRCAQPPRRSAHRGWSERFVLPRRSGHTPPGGADLADRAQSIHPTRSRCSAMCRDRPARDEPRQRREHRRLRLRACPDRSGRCHGSRSSRLRSSRENRTTAVAVRVTSPSSTRPRRRPNTGHNSETAPAPGRGGRRSALPRYSGRM